MQRMQEYKNKLKMDEINEKDEKIAEFKRQCEIFNQKKNMAALDLQRQKEEIVKKFEKIVKQNKQIPDQKT